MKQNKISQSALNTYLTCGAKYENHYIKRLRSKVVSGALLFGGAIDKALNSLLLEKNLKTAIKVFDSEWENGWINNKKVALKESELIVYAKKDFDIELLTFEDEKQFVTKFLELTEEETCLGLEIEYSKLLELKEKSEFENLPAEAKQLYNLANWLCLRRKAHLMLKSYNEKVLPKIKSIIAVQKEFNLVGKTGDIIPGWIDLLVEFNDGKKYVIDNKTSAMDYEPDSASKSKQLILYYYAAQKEGIKLDGVGFVVMYKQIQKNRIKICEKCGHDGTGNKFKSCDKITNVEGRCFGTWKETIKPECRIDIILNEVKVPAQNLIIKSFLGANEGIKAKIFPPNPDACENYGQRCAYYNLCWNGKDDTLIKLEDKNETK